MHTSNLQNLHIHVCTYDENGMRASKTVNSATTKYYYGGTMLIQHYDPKTGRFINCDDVNFIGLTELELSYNSFSYCENDSVNDSNLGGDIVY